MKLPLVIESVYPSESCAVTVKVTVPDAVPLSLGNPGTQNSPWVLVTVIVCPTVKLAVLWKLKEPPKGPLRWWL